MKYALILLTLLFSGCVSMVLPPKRANAELQIGQPIYVEPYRWPTYSRSLRDAIERTEIFTEVRTAEGKGEESYTAKVNRNVHGNAVIPFLTFISLGIIPTVTEEEFGESFFLFHEGETYRIEATWKGHTVLGWMALLLNLSPNRTSVDPETHPRFRAFLRYRIQESLKASHNKPDARDGL